MKDSARTQQIIPPVTSGVASLTRTELALFVFVIAFLSSFLSSGVASGFLQQWLGLTFPLLLCGIIGACLMSLVQIALLAGVTVYQKAASLLRWHQRG